MFDTDVVVIGAGLSGLQTARRLVEGGADVLVVEARDRVGGRLEDRRLAGDDAVVELGGQWVGHTQDRMYALLDELGLETFPTYNSGENLLVLGGARVRVGSGKGALPRRLNPFVLADLMQAQVRFHRLARTIPLEAPWEAPAARSLDSRTFESWIRSNLRSAAGRAYFRLLSEGLFATQSSDVSLLHVLFHVHSGTDLDTLVGIDEGARRDRIVGGSMRVVEAMADRLGDRVHLSSPVRRVVRGDRQVGVEVDDGSAITGRRVVVTLPPALAGRLAYDPVLPAWRDQLTQRVPAGSVIKVFGVYDEPFWRDEGLTGQVLADEGPVKVTFDGSPPSGSPGILVGFLEGEEARRLARVSAGERRAAVTASFAHHLGQPASSPREYVEHDWMAEPYTRGGHFGHLPPGVWTGFGPALRAPVGPIHWAGAETATVWNGHMEGAVRSGDRVADEVLAALA